MSINVIPILAAVLAQYLETQNWTMRQSIQALVLSVLMSKIWLKIGDLGGDLRQFPTQLYYMNQGPWISNSMYMLQGSLVLFLAYGVYHHWLKPLHPKPQRSAP